MDSSFSCQRKPQYEEGMVRLIVLQYDVKVDFFFHPNVRLTNQKPRTFVSVP